MSTRAVWIAVFAAACGPVAAGKGASGPSGKHGIEAAGLPYHVLDRSGHQVDEASFWAKVEAARVVCVGEEHSNPHHHWVQLQVVRHLAPKWPHLALGMEMFQRPFQAVLDDFAAHHISEADLRSRSGWEDRWGYDWGFYGPTIAAAVDAHAALVALNAPKELTKKVVHHGLESLTPAERAQMPELDLKVAAHRAWFDALMEDMGGSAAHSKTQAKEGKDEKADKADKADKVGKDGDDKTPDAPSEAPAGDLVYTVQVIWDETMADTAAKYVSSHDGARMVILAGNGHCHDSAIVDRVKRRGVSEVVSLRAVIDDGEGAVAEILAQPMNDFVVVLELPDDVKARMKAAAEHGDK
jgi:uncharacterized iron-regulated protein